jgi:hypothetical protein
MTKDLIWIAVPLTGFCLGLLPRPRSAFILLGICALVAAAYALSRYGGEGQGVLYGVILLGGGWAAILLFLGAMLGSVALYAADLRARVRGSGAACAEESAARTRGAGGAGRGHAMGVARTAEIGHGTSELSLDQARCRWALAE